MKGLAREESLPPSHYVLDPSFSYYFSFFRHTLFHLLAIFSRSFTLASDIRQAQSDVTVGSWYVNGITDTRSIINCLMSFAHGG